MAEVVAGVVLPEPPQTVEDLSRWHHRLDPEREVAGGAVAQDMEATRIHREGAADCRRALRGVGEREEPARLLRRTLDRRKRRAGLGDEGVLFRVDAPDAVHPFKRQIG